MSDIPNVLQVALDKLLSTESTGGSGSPRFVDAVWPYIHELAKIPGGVQLLDQYGNFFPDNTALATPYAEAWQRGVRAALKITTAVHDIEVSEIRVRRDRLTGKVKSTTRGSVRRELPNSVMQLRRTSRPKCWLSELENERSTIEKVLDAGSLSESVQKDLEAWWSETKKLLCEGQKCYVDGCRILRDMRENGIRSAGAAILNPEGFGPVFVEDVTNAAQFLVGELGRSSGKTVPFWDRKKKQLTFKTAVVKSFRQDAPNQMLVLDSFQELGWPDEIDDPLLKGGRANSKQRVRDTARDLNKRRRSEAVKFAANGKGTGFIWRREIL